MEHPFSAESPLSKSHSSPPPHSNNEKNRQHCLERSHNTPRGKRREQHNNPSRTCRTREIFRQKGYSNQCSRSKAIPIVQMLTETYRSSNKEKSAQHNSSNQCEPKHKHNNTITTIAVIIYLCHQISIRHPGRGAQIPVAAGSQSPSGPAIPSTLRSKISANLSYSLSVVSAHHVPKLSSKQSHYRSTTNSFAQCLLVAAISHIQPAAARTFCFHLHSH